MFSSFLAKTKCCSRFRMAQVRMVGKSYKVETFDCVSDVHSRLVRRLSGAYILIVVLTKQFFLELRVHVVAVRLVTIQTFWKKALKIVCLSLKPFNSPETIKRAKANQIVKNFISASDPFDDSTTTAYQIQFFRPLTERKIRLTIGSINLHKLRYFVFFCFYWRNFFVSKFIIFFVLN